MKKKIILLKKKLNYSTKNNSKIINRIFNHFISKNNQQKIFKSFYLSTNEIKKMSSMGMCIGSHGHSHHLLSNLNFNEQKLEIQKSKNFLENLLKKKIHHFCFPFGGPESYNSNTLKILRNLNFRNSFTVENKPLPKKINYYEIPRLDCNIFRFGKLN